MEENTNTGNEPVNVQQPATGQNEELIKNVQYVEVARKEDVPNATAVLVLGIISVVTIFCYGILGVIMGVIGLAMSTGPKRLINDNPERYSESSIKNLNAGRVMSIIGLCIGGAIILVFIIFFVMVGAAAMSPSYF